MLVTKLATIKLIKQRVFIIINLLRQRAEANGINIDEVLKNENGIAFQMIKME